MDGPDEVDWTKVKAMSGVGVILAVVPWLLGIAAKRKFAEDHRMKNRWTDKNRWEKD
jgi:hypothetical protein